MPLDPVAERYAQTLYLARLDEITKKYSRRTAETVAGLARRGLYPHTAGHFHSEMARIGVERIGELADARVDSFLAAYQHAEVPIDDEAVAAINRAAAEVYDAQGGYLIAGIRERVGQSGFPPAVAESISGTIETEMSRIKARINRRLLTLRDEVILAARSASRREIAAPKPETATHESKASAGGLVSRFWLSCANWQWYTGFFAGAFLMISVQEYLFSLILLVLSVVSLLSKLMHGKHQKIIKSLEGLGIGLGFALFLYIVVAIKGSNPWSHLQEPLMRVMGLNQTAPPPGPVPPSPRTSGAPGLSTKLANEKLGGVSESEPKPAAPKPSLSPRSGDSGRLLQWIQQLGQGTANQRLAGVSEVGAFISSSRPEERSLAELALSNAIAIEESETVRHAIVSSYENIDPRIVGKLELDKVLSLLAQRSRGLVSEGSLWFARSSNDYSLGRPHDGSAEARAKDVADSITGLLRKGARPHDLSGIYLVRCDLSKLNLAHTDFDNSILAWSDFDAADLSDATFNGADLEGVTFVETDLRRAHLTNIPTPPSNLALSVNHDYVIRDAAWPWRRVGQIMGPDFSCADLREADFRGHSLFFIASAPNFTQYFVSPRFSEANLERTDFRFALAYGIIYKSEFSEFPVSFANARGLNAGGHIWGDVETYTQPIGDNLQPSASKFALSFQMMAVSFSGSTWRGAQFPGSIRRAFERWPPPDTPRDPPCTPRDR